MMVKHSAVFLLSVFLLIAIGVIGYLVIVTSVRDAYISERLEALERDIVILCKLASWDLTPTQIDAIFNYKANVLELPNGEYQYLVPGSHFILDSNRNVIEFDHWYLGTISVQSPVGECSNQY